VPRQPRRSDNHSFEKENEWNKRFLSRNHAELALSIKPSPDVYLAHAYRTTLFREIHLVCENIRAILHPNTLAIGPMAECRGVILGSAASWLRAKAFTLQTRNIKGLVLLRSPVRFCGFPARLWAF
jgi:hypothetical protein